MPIQVHNLSFLPPNTIFISFLYDFGFQVIQLVTSVMYCLLESLAVSLNPQNDHWRLRDDAAHILARISRSPIFYNKHYNTKDKYEKGLNPGVT